MWFVWGYTIVSSCFLRLCFFQPFPFPFPLLKFVSFYLASFFLDQNQRLSKGLVSAKQKKHEWSWYTIVWFVWGYTIVSSCFLRLCFFQPFPFPFPLLKFVSFCLASFFLESKPKAFQRISFSQPKKHEWSWYTIVWFVWGYTIVSSCFLRWFCFFFNIPFTFSFAKVCFLLLSFIFLGIKTKGFLKD